MDKSKLYCFSHAAHCSWSKILILILLASVCLGVSSCSNAEKSKTRHYKKGVLLKERGRYTEAVDELQKAISIDPTMGEARLELGRCYHILRYDEEAISNLDAARRLNAKLILPAVLQIADIYAETGKYGLAEDVAAEALQKNQNNADLLLLLGKLEWKQDKADGARQWLTKALEADPGRVDAYIVLAEISMRGRDYQQAQRYLEKAAATEPDNSLVKLALAKAFRLSDKDEQATALLQEVLSKEPENITAIGALAEIYFSTNQLADARKQAEKLVRLSPGNPYANSVYGGILLKQGEYDQAVLYLTNAANASTATSKEHYLLGVALKKTAQPAQAISEFQIALTLDPDNFAARLMLAESYLSEGAFDKAEQEVKHLLSEAPENEQALQLAVRVNGLQQAFDHVEAMLSADGMSQDSAKEITAAFNSFHSGDLGSAQLACENILKKEPNSAIALNLLGLIYLKRNDLEQALGIFHHAIDADPNFAASHINVGNVYMVIGSYEAAADSFKEAMRLSPNDTVIPIRYVRALTFLKQEAKAEKFLKALLQENPQTPYRRELANLLMSLQKYDEARIQLSEILKEDPKNVEAGVLTAESFARQGDLQKAARDFENLVRVAPQSQYLRERLALCHLALRNSRKAQEILKAETEKENASGLAVALLMQEEGKYPEAERLFGDLQEDAYGENPYEIMILNIRSLQTMRDDSPKTIDSPFFSKAFVKSYTAMLKNQNLSPAQVNELNLALALARVRWISAALERLEHLKGEIKPNAALLELIGSFWEDVGKPAEAQKEYAVAMAAEPDYWPAYYRSGLLRAASGSHDEAIRSFEAGLKQKPDSVRMLIALAGEYELLGKDADAEKIYRKVNQIQPDLPPVLNNLAWLLSKRPNTLDQALQFAQDAVEAQPSKAALRDTLGWIYFQKGQYEKAREHLDRAILFDSSNPSIRYHRGMAYLKLGEAEKARQDFKKCEDSATPFPERPLVEQMLKQLSA